MAVTVLVRVPVRLQLGLGLYDRDVQGPGVAVPLRCRVEIRRLRVDFGSSAWVCTVEVPWVRSFLALVVWEHGEASQCQGGAG